MKKVPELNSLIETYVENEGVLSSSSSTYINKLVINFVPTITGNYLLKWCLEFGNSTVGKISDVRIIFLPSTVLSEISCKSTIAGAYEESVGGFKRGFLTQGITYSFVIQGKARANNIIMRNARLIISRSF